MTVTFFGHRDAPQEIEEDLRCILTDLIAKGNANVFYMGNQGAFDLLAEKVLKQLKTVYPHITYTVVLAYLPQVQGNLDKNNPLYTVYPEGLENVPKKFAIAKRNDWMIEQSDVVVTYVKYSFGGAAKFKALAEKRGKKIINLYG